MYLSMRFQNINDILSQLIFDEHISNTILLTENEGASIDNGTFVKPMASDVQKKRLDQNGYERIGRADITFINGVANNAIQINYPFHKEFPRIMTSVAGTNSKSVPRKKLKFTPFNVIACKT